MNDSVGRWAGFDDRRLFAHELIDLLTGWAVNWRVTWHW
jgi:hypothetical protein